MSNHRILAHAPSVHQIEEAIPRSGIVNIALAHGHYSIELAPLSRLDYLRRSSGRVSVAPEVAWAMVNAAKREGAIARVHRWGSLTTWHIRRAQDGRHE